MADREMPHDDEEAEPRGEDALEAEHAADRAVTHAVGTALPLPQLPDPEQPDDEEGLEFRASPEAEICQPASLVLEKKHPLAIRWMHWINFPVLFTMIWSGLLIYWNDSDNAYQHPHAVYRIGARIADVVPLLSCLVLYQSLLGYAATMVTKGLGYHFFFMWIFAINGIVYVLYLLWSRRVALHGAARVQSLRDAIQVTLVDLHLRKGLPPQTKYNGAQRIAYTSVIVMGAGLARDRPRHLQAHAGALADHASGRLRDGALAALLAHHGLLRLFPGACAAGRSRRLEQLSRHGQRL